jgi:UDP-N-acetylmuramate dehydrogenase
VPLAPLSTFGLGGVAAFYARVTNISELITALGYARDNALPYALIAGGSNMVFPDGVWPGLIIHLAAPDSEMVVAEGEITVSAGESLAQLIATSLEHGLAGLEALSGIPGSVGGAVVGNAGAYGQGISDYLVSVEIFDAGRSETRRVVKDECDFSYRESIFKRHRDWIVLSAKFKLTPGNQEELSQKSREIIAVRNAKYVPGIKCPGSFFKNVLVSEVLPEALAKVPAEKIRDGKIATGWLLEQVGARGMKEGEIEVASFHGNLLFNHGNGTAEQVRTLAEKLKKLVWKKFGINLAEEVRYLP